MKISPKKKRGRPLKDRRLTLNIAGTVDYRGTDDSQLYFVFRCPPVSLVVDIFKFLVGNGNGIAKNAVVTEEHDVIRRNGKGYWRVAVEIIEPNYGFCSLDDMKILIEGLFLKRHPCRFAWVPMDKFLNI